MAGLSVLLETAAQQHHASPTRTAQIISKTTLLNTKNGGSSSSSSSSRAPVAMAAATASTSSFLQRCFLCHRELADGKDIYIYRGDRAFCSDECRCRHIMTEEDGAMNCAKDAAAAPRGRSRRRQAVAGGFAY